MVTNSKFFAEKVKDFYASEKYSDINVKIVERVQCAAESASLPAPTKLLKSHKIILYINSLSAGIGSNDIGLDRGQLGNERLVYFSKAGNKLLLIQPNLKYRTSTSNVLEKQSVKEAFAESVLFGFPIIETSASDYLVDLTPFLMRDTHGVAQRLKQTKQGS